MKIFHGVQWDVGHPRFVWNAWLEEQILEVVERQPTINTRHLSTLMGTSHASARHKLQEQEMYP
jgi:hypothetical protein